MTQMKAAVHAFTLAGDLNPGETTLTSEPVKGKKTGDMLNAAEWNRVLELLAHLEKRIEKLENPSCTPFSQTFDLSGNSGNNTILPRIITTLEPGTYTISGSGSSVDFRGIPGYSGQRLFNTLFIHPTIHYGGYTGTI
jgi:hypothetical protein